MSASRGTSMLCLLRGLDQMSEQFFKNSMADRRIIPAKCIVVTLGPCMYVSLTLHCSLLAC